jgi:flavin-binding protein dodecin
MANRKETVFEQEQNDLVDAPDPIKKSNHLVLTIIEQAQTLWDKGQQDNAIELLIVSFTKNEKTFDSHNSNILATQAVCFLMRKGRFEEAKSFLHDNSGDDDEWHYLNALIFFCLEGDSNLARAALGCAFSTGHSIAVRLVEGKLDPQLNPDLASRLTAYIEYSEPAWLAQANAFAWLKQHHEDAFNSYNRESIKIAEHFGDSKRFQRIEDLQESADFFNQQKKDKEAKDALRRAIKEAERVEYSATPYLLAMRDLLVLYMTTGRPTDELEKQLLLRALRFEKETALAPPMDCIHMQFLGGLLTLVGESEKGIELLQRALENAEQHAASSKTFLNLFDVVDIRDQLAKSLARAGRHDQAAPLHLKNADIQESYLGKKHIDVISSLDNAHDCLLDCSDDAGAALVLERISDSTTAQQR